jgi:2-keto-4-pentenoate hydratase/2-oxohepta-3-ene-1,7-dioic acid hydratase in catechol pathway
MKVCTYLEDGIERLGFVVADQVVQAPPVFKDMRELIMSGEAGRKTAEAAISSGKKQPLSSVKLGAPIRPATMLCSGSNYRDHNKEKANTPISGKEPEFFVKTADCIIGDQDEIIYDPLFTKKLDAETELAVVIGRPGRHIPVERALEHVFGYTIVNDVTARDRQVRRNDQGFTWYELGRSKCFETSAPTGPWIVTSDEIHDPQRLRLRTRINGELRQSSSTANMIFSCAQLIHFFSMNMTLTPGTIIITGTPGGTAWSTDTELGGKWVGGDGTEELVPAKRYLLPGDVIECELEKIGVLRNVVGPGLALQ